MIDYLQLVPLTVEVSECLFTGTMAAMIFEN